VSYAIEQGSRRLEWLSSGGLYGIDPDNRPAYLREIELDELANLLSHLKHFGIFVTHAHALTLLREA
jgi:hypothetical protein